VRELASQRCKGGAQLCDLTLEVCLAFHKPVGLPRLNGIQQPPDPSVPLQKLPVQSRNLGALPLQRVLQAETLALKPRLHMLPQPLEWPCVQEERTDELSLGLMPMQLVVGIPSMAIQLVRYQPNFLLKAVLQGGTHHG